MSTEAELLAAIQAAPDDDAPLLVYADWLLERGNPRGELIQIRCALAKPQSDDKLREREKELLAALLPGLIGSGDTVRSDRAVRRGVVYGGSQTSTESGRVTYMNGSWWLRVYDLDTRAHLGELTGSWYSDDTASYNESGMLTDWWIEKDGSALVAVVDGKEQRRLELPA